MQIEKSGKKVAKIVAMTCMCVDIFHSLEQAQPGGESLIFTANCCDNKDTEVYIIGAIGNDKYGQIILDSIANKKIHTEYIHKMTGTTASNRTYLTEDGDRYYKEDSWNGGVYQEFVISDTDKKLMAEADLIHTSIHCPNFKDIIEIKKHHDFMLAVDFDTQRDSIDLEEYLEYIDFFFISGDEKVIDIVSELSKKYYAIFIVTLAEKGSIAYHNGKKYIAKAVKVEQIIDTTGCGDSYQAGFLCEYLKNSNIENAMEEGSKAAAKTLSFVGGFQK